MSDPILPFAGVTTPEPGLVNLIKRAQWLAALDPLLRQCLPTTVADQTRLANVDEHRLVFLVSSPAWKTRLRPYGNLIEAAAAAAGLPGRTLVIKVAPGLFPPAHHTPASDRSR